ncbi:MAG: alpha/beta hydrolase [Ruminococcaceae bacterium]|nr:alpha/beta hydrolase [Oscillospiraceae bacterium]
MQQYTEKVYATDLGDIHYWISRTEKTAPWLVMLPGLTADHRLFDRQIEGLSHKYNCFCWDAPAHGKSRPFTLQFSMADMCRYLHNIFTAEDIDKPILIGQSLGGYISQVYMDMHPNSVSGFISVDSCSLKRKYYTNWELYLLKRTKWMYMSIPWDWLVKLGTMGTATSSYGRSLMHSFITDYSKEAYCNLADHGYRIFAQAVEADKPYDISCPVLLLCGEKDGAGSAKSYNRRWARQDGYKLVWLKGAGHNANTDVPDIVNNLIENFADEIFKEVML